MRWKLVALLVAVAAGAAAFAVRGSGTYQVAGQRFVVPDRWSFGERIAWLPPPDAESFMFHLDRIRDRDQTPRYLVLVEPADRLCRNGRMAPIAKIACGGARTTPPVGPPYRKVFRLPGYAFEWAYYSGPASPARRQAQGFQVASCFSTSLNPEMPGGMVSCTSEWRVDGLVLSLGFEESELARLRDMRARATRMLLSWKVR